MFSQQMVIDDKIEEINAHHFTPSIPALSRSDVCFPLATTRGRAPSTHSIGRIDPRDGQTVGRLTIRARDQSRSLSPERHGNARAQKDTCFMEDDTHSPATSLPSIDNLPLEVQAKVLDYIFGEVHAVNAGAATLRGTNVSRSMRHPRRKAVSELALVSKTWRELVQARIYRHIKIKGTRAGLAESEDYFGHHHQLTRYVRHIEFWVPVWGDKAATIDPDGVLQRLNHMGVAFGDENLMTTHDMLGFNFKLSVYSATLSEIFYHTRCFFPEARIFTLEGGHCRKSNMIRQFPQVLFQDPSQQRLESLPNIRTFAMRGAWNIMRDYSHWETIEKALPNIEEWHCGYAKPRQEAYTTINEILPRLPIRLRHLNLSLDGMYSKDDTTLGSNSLLSSMHLCEQLGRVAPHMESLSHTGKICECFWAAAIDEATRSKVCRLESLEIVVKSCCRQRVSNYHQETGETITEELGGIMADGAGITNLVFIKAFERLVASTVEALPFFPKLNQVRIRYIDLDSPCALLNPYWHLKGNRVYGIWNDEIVERLEELRPGTTYEELGDGLGSDVNEIVKKDEEGMDGSHSTWITGVGPVGGGASGISLLYPKRKPKSIKTSSYRAITEARST